MLLRLARDADVLLESFRPGVLDRLGVGYERLREENQRLVYCAITGYGQDGPNRDRSGHDMNYLGLDGLLGLTGDRRWPAGPVGRADRRPRRRRADGRGRACSSRCASATARARASSSTARCSTARCRGWRWSRPTCSPPATCRRAARCHLAGGVTCYRPYQCADGYVTLGALEPKFWAEFCRGVGREDLLEHAFDPPGSDAHARGDRGLRDPHPRGVAAVRVRARLLPRAGARPRRGAVLGAGRRPRDGRRARPAGRGAAGEAARGAVQAQPHARGPDPGARAGARRATPTSCSPPPATPPRRSRRCTRAARSPARRPRRRARS